MALIRQVLNNQSTSLWAYVETSDENADHAIILGDRQFKDKEEAVEWSKGFKPDSYEWVNPIVYEMNFGLALEVLEAGGTVARAGWNGKGMFLKMIGEGDYGISVSIVEGFILELLPWIGMKTADDKFVPWLASQTDILAKDWGVIKFPSDEKLLEAIQKFTTGTDGVLMAEDVTTAPDHAPQEDVDELKTMLETPCSSEQCCFAGEGYYDAKGLKVKTPDDDVVESDGAFFQTHQEYIEHFNLLDIH